MGFPNINQDHVARVSPKVMVDGDIIFNIVGDIQILSLVSECYTANDATASRVQYVAHSNLDGDTTITGLCTTLANATPGTAIVCDNTSLSSAPNVVVSGISLNMDSRGIRAPSGYIKLHVTIGSTTGTWAHYIRYEPLETGAYVY